MYNNKRNIEEAVLGPQYDDSCALSKSSEDVTMMNFVFTLDVILHIFSSYIVPIYAKYHHVLHAYVKISQNVLHCFYRCHITNVY